MSRAIAPRSERPILHGTTTTKRKNRDNILTPFIVLMLRKTPFNNVQSQRETSWKSTPRFYSVCFHNNNNNYSAFITMGERESLSMRWGWYLLYSGPQWPDLIENICGNSPLVRTFFSFHFYRITYFGGKSVRVHECNYASMQTHIIQYETSL